MLKCPNCRRRLSPKRARLPNCQHCGIALRGIAAAAAANHKKQRARALHNATAKGARRAALRTAELQH